MSSHHIVRENQEPALLIEDLFLIDEEHLGQLLEWSPTIIVGNKMDEVLHVRGYKVDIIFTQGHVDQAQENLKIIFYNGNFIQAVLDYLIDHDYKAVNIITDQIDLISYKPYLERINVVLLSGNMRYYFITSGFTKWKAGGERIYIDSLGWEIMAEGLIKIEPGLYETEKDGLFRLAFSESKYILIGETFA